MARFLDRRTNFQGKHFIVMTEEQKPYIHFNSTYKTKARYFPHNQTYDIGHFTHGLILDILNVTMKHHNATFFLYKRKDGKWGSLKNGTWNGMFNNLVYGSADLIATSLSRSIDRDRYATFLPPIDSDKDALYIKIPNEQNYSWHVFYDQFSWDVWLALIIQGFVIAFVTTSLEAKFSDSNFSSFGWLSWCAISSNFGNGRFNFNLTNHPYISKLVVVSVLLSGTIVWMHYRAFIFAILSVSHLQIPFDSPESLLQSDYTVKAKLEWTKKARP